MQDLIDDLCIDEIVQYPNMKEGLYKAIVEQSNDVISVLDNDGVIQYVTPSLEKTLGYAPEELTGTNVLEHIHPDDSHAAREAIYRTVIDDHRDPAVTVRIRHSNGQWRYIEVTGGTIKNPGIDGLVLHARDVTDKQASINELMISEESFQAAFNASSTLSAITYPDSGEHINVNEAWLETLGWSREEVIGKTALELNVWGNSENRRKVLTPLNKDGYLKQFRAELYTRDGEPRNVLVDAKFLELETGKVAYFSSIDVTERDKIESQLRQSQKIEALGQLTGNIAHDFNNLLSVIIGNAELGLLNRETEGPPTNEFRAIMKAADNGAHLIQQLLSFSRKQNLSPKSFCLGEHMQQMEALLTTSIGKDIELSIEAREGDWMCHVDPRQFENAILNMAINARDAMPEGGKLAITTSREKIAPHQESLLQKPPPGDYLRLCIEDTGHGIPTSVINKVFEPFYTTKDEGSGTGLGLSMVFGFVKQSGGYIHIESSDKGTKLVLRLPPAGDIAQFDAATELAEPELHAFAGRRALLVEDNEGILRIISSMLQSFGFFVVEAESGDDALTRMNVPYDILVTDVMLQGTLKGPDVAAKFREQSPSSAVLYMSGFDQGLLRQELLEGGRVSFLQKPFTRVEVAEKLDMLLNNSSVN